MDECVKEKKFEIVHSKEYKNPELFIGKKVLVVGAGFSAMDIGSELKENNVDVTISFPDDFVLDKFTEAVFASRLEASNRNFNWAIEHHKPMISKFCTKSGKTIFADGNSEYFDIVLMCTGYQYDFPFFSEEIQEKLKSEIL